MKKMTYTDALNVVIELVDGEVKDKLIALKESIAKRNSGDKKPTKTQIANEGLKADILTFLADGGKYTVTEIIAGVPTLADASNQKVASLVRQLVGAKAVVREEIKRKAYFSIA